jgi:hypothetical protein
VRLATTSSKEEIMKESEAKEKWCPMTLGKSRANHGTCYASGCMWWTIISKVDFQTSLAQLESHQDPVDAVYISRLIPDAVSKVDIHTLQKYSQIEDLSDTLEFTDGLDD